MIEVAIENHKPVRIGVNWGSLDQALLTRMMDENSRRAEPQGRPRRDDGSHDGQRLHSAELAEKLRPAGQTRSSSAPKSAACRT